MIVHCERRVYACSVRIHMRRMLRTWHNLHTHASNALAVGMEHILDAMPL